MSKSKALEALEEENRHLHSICRRQMDSLAAQQEAIVHLTLNVDSTLACVAEKYGDDAEVNGRPAKQMTIATADYPGVLDRKDVHTVIENDEYVITVAEKEHG